MQPNDDKVIVSVLNLGNKGVSLSSSSVIGTVSAVNQIVTCEEGQSLRSERQELPPHLKPLLDSCSKELSVDQRQALTQLVLDFEDIFVGEDGTLGQTSVVTHTIDTSGSVPIKLPARRVPLSRKQVIEDEVDKMLAQGVIEESDSPWSAPVCLVTKKDGSCRFCIDFRKLNSVSRRDAYPIPIDETLETLGGSKWFSTLDLASGYWQVKMDPKDKHKTAFATHLGLYHFNVMPFGLTNAPATFERLMDKVLGKLRWKKCLCYLDDVIVFGSTFCSALENLRMVFLKLRQANLKLKPKKCTLFQTEVAFLGHIVSNTGIKCSPEKTSAVKDWPKPENRSEVRSFVGYYRHFISNFSKTAFPLNRLTRKGIPFL